MTLAVDLVASEADDLCVFDFFSCAVCCLGSGVGGVVAKREIVKPARGRVALAPATLQRLTSNRDLYSEVGNRERKHSEPEVLPVPETVPFR